ncbi:glycosyltransferase family 4 protein [Pseudomonadota bacterium]
MNILSPMPSGNGAHVMHKQLEEYLPGYRVRSYSPWWTLAPISLPWFVRGKQMDLIHTELNYACFFKRPGVPLIATAHGYSLDAFLAPYSSPLQRLHYRTDLRWFVEKSLAVADRVTAVSQYLADKLQQHMQRSTDIQVIYNGVDEIRFQPLFSTSAKKQPFRILFCGKLTRKKGADMIAPLAKELGSNYEIHHVGGGELNTNDIGAGKIVSLGKISYKKMHELYHSVDALFVPSVREGFGLSIAEAMACGLPVVANNCSAIPELIKDEDGGFLCEIGQIDQYADAFKKLLADPQLCRSMGEYNRVQVEEKFTLSRMVSQYQNLFESVR